MISEADREAFIEIQEKTSRNSHLFAETRAFLRVRGLTWNDLIIAPAPTALITTNGADADPRDDLNIPPHEDESPPTKDKPIDKESLTEQLTLLNKCKFYYADLTKYERNFIDDNLKGIHVWGGLRPRQKNVLNRTINRLKMLEIWQE